MFCSVSKSKAKGDGTFGRKLTDLIRKRGAPIVADGGSGVVSAQKIGGSQKTDLVAVRFSNQVGVIIFISP